MSCHKSWRCMMRVWLAVAFLLAGLIVGIWDVFVTARGEPGNTVSSTLYEWSIAYPILPFVLGVITGHLFWPHLPRVPLADVPTLGQ